MKEHHFKISKLASIMTFDEAVMLSKLYAYSCNGFPYPIPFMKLYRNVKTKANLITSVITDFIRWNGGQAERINTTGIYRNGKWTTSGSTKGSADISAIINGKSFKIEVKVKDKQSEAQKKYQESVERAGGIYLLVHSFTEFYNYDRTYIHGNIK